MYFRHGLEVRIVDFNGSTALHPDRAAVGQQFELHRFGHAGDERLYGEAVLLRGLLYSGVADGFVFSEQVGQSTHNVLYEVRFLVGLVGVPKSGIEHSTVTKGLVPGDGVVIAVLTALVSALVHPHQGYEVILDVLVVVPLIFTYPGVLQKLRSRMIVVIDQHGSLGLSPGVALEVGAD